MFLGQIIAKSSIEGVPFYIKVVEDTSDFSIPTLIVGKKRAIELFGQENIHVLDKKIKENVFWTFAKNERRTDNEEDIRKFIEKIASSINGKVNYYFINIFTEKLSFLKKFIKYIYGNERKSIYISDNHVYIYGGKNVIGLSLSDFEYAGIDSAKVIRKIKSNPNNIVFSEEDLSKDVLKSVKGSKIVLPYLHYLQV